MNIHPNLPLSISVLATALEVLQYYMDIFLGTELSCYDSLSISGGSLKEFCGTTTPAPFSPGLNVVTLKMESDANVEEGGFDLSFTTTQSMYVYSTTVITLGGIPFL